jgi:hypothetical protein
LILSGRGKGFNQVLQSGKLLESGYGLLGKLPERRGVPEARTVDSRVESGIKIGKLILDLNGLEPVPAYFLKSAGAEGRLPLVVYNHSHGGFYDVGKEEVLRSAPYLPKRSYGEAMTAEGYAVLCIDRDGGDAAGGARFSAEMAVRKP